MTGGSDRRPRPTGRRTDRATGPTAKRPTAKRPTNKRPTNKRPTNKRPTNKRPTNKRPTAARPTATPSAAKRSPATRPTATRPTATPASATASAPRAARSGVRRRRAAIVATFVAVMVVLVAIPGRGYLEQRQDVASAQADLHRLQQENDRLQRRRDRLDDPTEIQRIARRDYGLVDQGEESYTVLPPPTAGLVLPRAWPFNQLADAVRRAADGT